MLRRFVVRTRFASDGPLSNNTKESPHRCRASSTGPRRLRAAEHRHALAVRRAVRRDARVHGAAAARDGAARALRPGAHPLGRQGAAAPTRRGGVRSWARPAARTLAPSPMLSLRRPASPSRVHDERELSRCATQTTRPDSQARSAASLPASLSASPGTRRGSSASLSSSSSGDAARDAADQRERVPRGRADRDAVAGRRRRRRGDSRGRRRERRRQRKRRRRAASAAARDLPRDVVAGGAARPARRDRQRDRARIRGERVARLRQALGRAQKLLDLAGSPPRGPRETEPRRRDNTTHNTQHTTIARDGAAPSRRRDTRIRSVAPRGRTARRAAPRWRPLVSGGG